MAANLDFIHGGRAHTCGRIPDIDHILDFCASPPKKECMGIQRPPNRGRSLATKCNQIRRASGSQTRHRQGRAAVGSRIPTGFSLGAAMHESKNHEPFAHFREVWSLLSIAYFEPAGSRSSPSLVLRRRCGWGASWNVVVQASCGLHLCLLKFVAVDPFEGEATFRFLFM